MPSTITEVVVVVVVVVVMIDTKSIAMIVAVVIVGATVIDRKAAIPATVEARLAKNDSTHSGTLVATNDFNDIHLLILLLLSVPPPPPPRNNMAICDGEGAPQWPSQAYGWPFCCNSTF